MGLGPAQSWSAGPGENRLTELLASPLPCLVDGEAVSLLPESKMKEYQLPKQVIERVTDGHYQNWIQAVKGGKPACSNFSIAGPYAEWILLGAVCWRFPNEELKWDGANLRFSNNDKANEFLKPYYRKGWELPENSV